jgi:hypothetical protein
MVGLTDLREEITVYRTLSGESRNADSESIEDWKNYYRMKLKVMNCVIYANETRLLFKLQCSKALMFQENICIGRTKSKQWITVLLACNCR